MIVSDFLEGGNLTNFIVEYIYYYLLLFIIIYYYGYSKYICVMIV